VAKKEEHHDITVLKRVFIILSSILVVVIAYSVMFKLIGEPDIKEIYSESFADVRVYFDGGINEKYTSGTIEHVREFYISYPPIYSRKIVCYILPNNSRIYSPSGDVVNYTQIDDKICWSAKYDHIIVKYHQPVDLKSVVLSIKEGNVTRIKIFNPYTFGMRVEMVADLEKPYGNNTVDVYKGDFLLTRVRNNFYDNVMLTPFSYIEYKFSVS